MLAAVWPQRSIFGFAALHQSPPIVNNGYMYVTTPGAQVIALDAASGVELWRYKKELPADMLQLHPTNRGVALYGDKVYLATVDAHLVALDARTGKVAWTQEVINRLALRTLQAAPWPPPAPRSPRAAPAPARSAPPRRPAETAHCPWGG